MSSQYRLKDDWKPVGSSKSAKKLSDWMNAIAKQLNRAEVVSGGTACPTDLGFRIEVDTGDKAYPFEVINDPDNPSTKVLIRGGIFEVIHAFSTTHASDMQVTPLTIDATTPQTTGNFTGAGSLPTQLATMTSGTIPSSPSGETRWIYLVPGNATIIGELAQASNLFAYVSASSTRPDEDVIDNPSNPGFELDPKSVKVLAKVVNTDGDIVITQEWTGGNIKEVAVGLDTYDGYNRASGQLSKSLFYDEFGRMSLYDFAGQLHGKVPYAQNGIAGAGDDDMTLAYAYANLIGDSASGVSADPIVDISTSGTSLTWSEDRYEVGTSVDGMSVWTEGGGSGGSVDLSTLIGDWWTAYVVDPVVKYKHDKLTNLTTNDDHNAGSAKYIIDTGDASRNDFKVGSMLGDHLDANSLSPDLRTLYGIWHSNETDASDSDVTANSFYSLGGLGVTKGLYSEAGGARPAGKFLNDISGADVTVLLAEGSVAGQFDTLSYATTIADDGASFSVKAYQNGGGTLTCYLVDATYAVNATDGRINSIDGFTFNGTDGVTITNWLGGGIVTGTDIVEIDASDLRPTDKILVRR